jgi:hypothetical protein
MTTAVRLQLTLNDIRAARGQYAAMSAVARQLLINDLRAGRKAV